MARIASTRTSVFISYSHRDERWLQRVMVHLRPLARDHGLEIWNDTRIESGTEWRPEIKNAIASAKVAILIVSADFLASDFISSDELPPMLDASKSEGAVILPLIVGASRFLQTAALSRFEAVNDPLRPLAAMPEFEQEEIFVRLANQVERILGSEAGAPEGPRRQPLHSQHNGVSKSSSTHLLSPTPKVSIGIRGVRKNRVFQIIAASIGAAVVLIGAAYQIMGWGARRESPEVRITGRVANAQTDEPIRKAEVSLEAGGIPQGAESDSKGIFSARLVADYSAVRIRVAARGFKPYDQLLPRDSSNQVVPVNLEPEPGVKPTPTSPQSRATAARVPQPPSPAKVSTASILNTSLPAVSGEAGPWAVILFGEQERREDVTSSVRSALSGSGRETVSLFRKVADEQRLAPDIFRGSGDVFQELQPGRYCSRIFAGRLSVVRLGTTQGITFARATLSVHLVSPAGEVLKMFELSEKGGGEDESTARRKAVDELIDGMPRELPGKID